MTADGGQPSRTSKTVKGVELRTSKALKGVAGGVPIVAAIIASLGVLGVFQGSTDAKARLEQAAENTLDAGSARLAVQTTIRRGVSLEQSKEIGFSRGNGVLDFIGAIGEIEDTSGVIERFLDPYIYLSTPDIGSSALRTSASQGPGTRDWCQFDLTRTGLGSGYLFGAITGFQSDPGAVLQNLRENGTGPPKEIGSEKLHGVETTHYAGQIDTQKLLSPELDPNRIRLIQGVAKLNKVIPIQVWIGSDDLPVRIQATTVIRPFTFQQLKFDFSDFGVQVDAQPPSAYFREGTHGCPTLSEVLSAIGQ